MRITPLVLIVLFALLSMGNVNAVQTTDPTTSVQAINTFLNISQFGVLMFLLWRSDNALMRQRSEQSDERKWLIGLLVTSRNIGGEK